MSLDTLNVASPRSGGARHGTGIHTSTAHDIGIGGRLKAARQRLGWRREELAFHSGVSWSAIAQVESGRRSQLRPTTLAALAHALGVTIDYVITGRAPVSPMFEHQALLYDSEDEFERVATPYLAAAVERGEPALAVTTRANIVLLRERLDADAGCVQFAEQASWYRTPASALNRYREFITAHLDEGAAWVRIVGEAVWAGRSDNEIRLWTRYESLLNLVFSAWPVSVLCPYDTRVLDAEVVHHADATHPRTIERGTLEESDGYIEPGGFVLEA